MHSIFNSLSHYQGWYRRTDQEFGWLVLAPSIYLSSLTLSRPLELHSIVKARDTGLCTLIILLIFNLTHIFLMMIIELLHYLVTYVCCVQPHLWKMQFCINYSKEHIFSCRMQHGLHINFNKKLDVFIIKQRVNQWTTYQAFRKHIPF